MEKKIKFFNTLFIIPAVILIITSGCDKDKNNDNITITDADDNIYHTVVIDTQTWMVENLKTTKYNDGTDIPNITDNTAWESLTTDAYCNYDNSEANADIYGRLYNWYAVNTGKLAPTGWHIPTDAEWTILTDYLGGLDIAGGKIKETGTTHWTSPNTGSTNTCGFTALPGGHRYFDGYFSSINNSALWWSSTEKDADLAWFRSIGYDNILVRRDPYNKNNGFSIRCIKN